MHNHLLKYFLLICKFLLFHEIQIISGGEHQLLLGHE